MTRNVGVRVSRTEWARVVSDLRLAKAAFPLTVAPVHKGSIVRRLAGAIIAIVVIVSVARSAPVLRFYAKHAPVWGAKKSLLPRTDFARKVVEGARLQIGTIYDASYADIGYPNGDVSPDLGACSDVVVRALRHAGVELQQLIHEDMAGSPTSYPELANVALDPSIDHRRCINQIQFLARHSQVLTTDASAATRDQWLPGDLVYWRLWGDREHIGVISDHANEEGLPLVIHNGSVCIEEDCLTDWEIIGHYRMPK